MATFLVTIRRNWATYISESSHSVDDVPRGLRIAPRLPLDDEDDRVRRADEQEQDQEVGKNSFGNYFPVLLL